MKMKCFSMTTKLLAPLVLAFGLMTAQAQADQSSLIVSRDSQNAKVVNLTLTKDVYRSEEYQDNYTVDVPYEDTETYTEQVPYQDTETYTEQEPYQESENVCHTQTDYERQCRNEQVCHHVPRRECHNNQVCHQIPHEQCEDHQVCHGHDCHNERHCHTEHHDECHNEEHCENRDEQECHNEERCENVPHSHQVCQIETVTKYRNVTKTREVTRYREEQRTRIVTRYRQETRCCVTKTRDVFDHQYAASILVNFPVEASLSSNESETFLASLTDSDASARLNFEPKNTIYGYAPAAIAQRSIDHFEVTMHVVPKYTGADLGKNTISGLKLENIAAVSAHIYFNDSGVLPKVNTNYQLQVLEPISGKELANFQQASAGQTKIDFTIPAIDPSITSVLVKLAVARNGVVLDGPVQFLLEGNLAVKKEAPYNPAPFLNPDLVDSSKLSGPAPNTVLQFIDHTDVIPQVKTEYHVKLTLADGKILADKIVKRDLFKATDDGTPIKLSLLKDLGVSADDMAGLKSGTAIALELNVLRYGSRFTPSPSVVTITDNLKIK